jgi:hypothetical protein
MEEPIFEYETDWFQFFQEYLEKKKTDVDDKIKIKANIIESNQTIETLRKKYNTQLEVFPSKEPFFYNIKLHVADGTVKYLYLNTLSTNTRFWILHNIEKVDTTELLLSNIFQDGYKQDKIYLPNDAMEFYRNNVSAYSLGMNLAFRYPEEEEDSGTDNFYEKVNNELNNLNMSLRVWSKNQKSIETLLSLFRKVNFPINYTSLNCVFENDLHEITLKEDLFTNGKLTIHRGKDFSQHMKFVKRIRSDYQVGLFQIEEHLFDISQGKGDIFVIELENEYNPKALFDYIGKSYNEFKLYVISMDRDGDSYQYLCIDGHTGDKFYINATKRNLYINLPKSSCGNVILRLFSKIQNYLEYQAKLFIGQSEFKWNQQ